MKMLKQVGSFLYAWWMRFAHLLALINTCIILTIVYVVIIGPISLFVRLTGKDFLNRRIDASPTYWKTKEAVQHTIESARRQF